MSEATDKLLASIKAAITGRGVQLLARWLSKSLIAAGAVEVAGNTRLIEIVATGAAAALCVAVDMLSHRYQAAIQSQVVQELAERLEAES